MIKKSLLLLALLCGSAVAVAPATKSNNNVGDFLTTVEETSVKKIAPTRINGFTFSFDYEDDYGNIVPIKGAKIRIRERIGANDILVEEGYTSDYGTYSIYDLFDAINPGDPARAYYFQLFAEGEGYHVTDIDEYAYIWESDEYSNPVNKVINIHKTFSTSDALGKAFSICSCVRVANKFAKYMNPTVDFGNAHIYYPGTDAGAYYSARLGGISLSTTILSGDILSRRPNVYEDFDVICHEYGHYVQDVLDITENPGGTHYIGYNHQDYLVSCNYEESMAREAGIRLAYAEGWATSFSLLAQRHFESEYAGLPFFADSSYTAYNGVNEDYATYPFSKGEGSEDSIISFIWNLFDEYSDDDPADSLEYEDSYFMEMSESAFIFSDFLRNLKSMDYDEEAVAELLIKCGMAPTYVDIVGNYFTNVCPTFQWDCAGGSYYFPNNEFTLRFEAENGYQHVYYEDEVVVNDRAKTGTYVLPYNIWQQILATGAHEYTVVVEASCDYGVDNTGSYRSRTYRFVTPTGPKSGIDEVIISPEEWNFPVKYDSEEQITVLRKDGYELTTRRLRTGRIDKEQIVLSAKKKDAGLAYFEVTSKQPMKNVYYDVSLWGNSEGIKPTNSTIIVELLDEEGNWYFDNDLWTVSLPTDRENMLSMNTNNFEDFYGIRWTVTAPATGSHNNGRLVLKDISFNF